MSWSYVVFFFALIITIRAEVDTGLETSLKDEKSVVTIVSLQ